MRRSLALATIALSVATTALAPPAGARATLDGDRARAGGGKVTCPTTVLGVDSTGHLTYDLVKNDKVQKSSRSKKALPFDVTAIGFYDSVKSTNFLDAVTDSGTPRQIASTVTAKGKISYKSNKKYAQNNYAPGLFADNIGYYAYTVERGKLVRWILTLYPDKRLKFAQKAVLGKGFGDLTSLQSANIVTFKGSDREVLYGTTVDGALIQLVVPLDKPGSYKLRTLADTGYAGVTELSWTVCNNKADYHSLIAIDGETATATWTTIKDALDKPKSTLQGQVTGSKGWDLVGAV